MSTRLSSQRLIATALVNSDSDSRVTTLVPTVGQPKITALAVEHLDRDPAHDGLVGDDPRVRVELGEALLLLPGANSCSLIGVLALDARPRDRSNPIRSYSAIAPSLSCSTERSICARPRAMNSSTSERTSRPPTPGRRDRRVDRQTPQARAVLLVAEELTVVDAGHGADHRAGLARRSATR